MYTLLCTLLCTLLRTLLSTPLCILLCTLLCTLLWTHWPTLPYLAWVHILVHHSESSIISSFFSYPGSHQAGASITGVGRLKSKVKGQGSGQQENFTFTCWLRRWRGKRINANILKFESIKILEISHNDIQGAAMQLALDLASYVDTREVTVLARALEIKQTLSLVASRMAILYNS